MLLKAKDKLPFTGKALRLAFGRSTLFASSFDKVEKRRESLASELNGRLHERANVIPTKAIDCIMAKLHHITGKGSIDCKMVSQHIAFTLLGATVFGDTFLAWSKATIYEEILMMIAKDAYFWASYSVTPFWERGFWSYQQLCTKLKCLTQDLVQQCSKNYKLYHHMDPIPHNGTANAGIEATVGSKSFYGIFLQDNFSLQELNGHLNAREEPRGNIMGMMFHGCLTTGGLISNMLMRLVTHPEIQHKIYSEKSMARKGSGERNQPNVEKMPLLLATVYEAARVMPAGPLLQRCSLKHGPAEELLEQRQNSFVLNDPNENPAFLPFGSGTHACLCQKFVVQGVATLFASLLEQYEVRLYLGSKTNSKPLTNDSIFQNFPSSEIVFVKRNN
ncbi:hypothetical protein CRYUN_Cryun05aG0112700 [Craigia yunnanensis]